MGDTYCANQVSVCARIAFVYDQVYVAARDAFTWGKVGGICADDDLRHFNFDYAAYIMYQREPHLALFSLIWHRYGAGLWHGHSSRVLLAMVDLRTLILTCCVLFEFFVTHK